MFIDIFKFNIFFFSAFVMNDITLTHTLGNSMNIALRKLASRMASPRENQGSTNHQEEHNMKFHSFLHFADIARIFIILLTTSFTMENIVLYVRSWCT